MTFPNVLKHCDEEVRAVIIKKTFWDQDADRQQGRHTGLPLLGRLTSTPGLLSSWSLPSIRNLHFLIFLASPPPGLSHLWNKMALSLAPWPSTTSPFILQTWLLHADYPTAHSAQFKVSYGLVPTSLSTITATHILSVLYARINYFL